MNKLVLHIQTDEQTDKKVYKQSENQKTLEKENDFQTSVMTLNSSMKMRHGNYVVYTILYTDQFKSDFISYYLTYFLCNNINQTQGLLYMTTATPGAHSLSLSLPLSCAHTCFVSCLLNISKYTTFKPITRLVSCITHLATYLTLNQPNFYFSRAMRRQNLVAKREKLTRKFKIKVWFQTLPSLFKNFDNKK